MDHHNYLLFALPDKTILNDSSDLPLKFYVKCLILQKKCSRSEKGERNASDCSIFTSPKRISLPCQVDVGHFPLTITQISKSQTTESEDSLWPINSTFTSQNCKHGLTDLNVIVQDECAGKNCWSLLTQSGKQRVLTKCAKCYPLIKLRALWLNILQQSRDTSEQGSESISGSA